MRLLLALFLTAAATASAHDALGVGCETCDSAHRAYEAAAFAAHNYQRFDSLSAERRLRGEITFSEARIASLRRQVSEYDRINRFGTGSALRLSADRARLDLLREELIRRDLREQLVLSQRDRRHQRHVHAYAVDRAVTAATRAAARGDGSIKIVNH